MARRPPLCTLRPAMRTKLQGILVADACRAEAGEAGVRCFALDHVAMNVRETFLHWITRVCIAGRIFALRAACFGGRGRFCVAGTPFALRAALFTLRAAFLRCGQRFCMDRVCDQSVALAIHPCAPAFDRSQTRWPRSIRPLIWSKPIESAGPPISSRRGVADPDVAWAVRANVLQQLPPGGIQ